MTTYTGGKSCHKLVAETAKEMAGVAVQEMLLDDGIYKKFQAKYPEKTLAELEATLINLTWPALIEQARATLAKLLATPIDESLKDQILSALILDNTLRGRKRGGGSRLGR